MFGIQVKKKYFMQISKLGLLFSQWDILPPLEDASIYCFQKQQQKKVACYSLIIGSQ